MSMLALFCFFYSRFFSSDGERNFPPCYHLTRCSILPADLSAILLVWNGTFPNSASSFCCLLVRLICRPFGSWFFRLLYETFHQIFLSLLVMLLSITSYSVHFSTRRYNFGDAHGNAEPSTFLVKIRML